MSAAELWGRNLTQRIGGLLGRGARDKVLLTWWGAFPGGGGATIGDYMAVQNVASRLVGEGIPSDIATSPEHSFVGASCVDVSKVDPNQYCCVVFVCGPIVSTKHLRRLLKRFQRSTKIAVGVSVLDENPGGAALFDQIVARDGTPDSTFDVALAENTPYNHEGGGPRTHVALCFRGRQSEYGPEACLHEKAESILTAAGRACSLPLRPIDTVIRPDNSISDIETAFATARVTLTTRLHGALLALRHGVPFIAIDQIAGGRKLSAVLRRVDWPFVFEGGTVTSEQVASAMQEIETRRGLELLVEARARAIALSTDALSKSVTAIRSALPPAAAPAGLIYSN